LLIKFFEIGGVKMKFKQLEAKYGDDAQIAVALERSPSCIAKWRANAKKGIAIPRHAQLAIQAISNNALKADKPKRGAK
jgi:hypothetical protein